MKTSILISTFTVLYSLVIFAGTPLHHKDVNKNTTLVCNNSFIPSSLVVSMEIENKANGEEKEPNVKAAVPTIEDFHYLKFEVASYSSENEKPDEENGEITFDYLKFIVPQVPAYNELTPDIIELPVNEFEYLKFDVRNYADNPGLNSI